MTREVGVYQCVTWPVGTLEGDLTQSIWWCDRTINLDDIKWMDDVISIDSFCSLIFSGICILEVFLLRQCPRSSIEADLWGSQSINQPTTAIKWAGRADQLFSFTKSLQSLAFHSKVFLSMNSWFNNAIHSKSKSRIPWNGARPIQQLCGLRKCLLRLLQS